MANMIIVGKDCERCIHASVDESNKAKITVKCNIKNKEYVWGTCIPCEYWEAKNGN